MADEMGHFRQIIHPLNEKMTNNGSGLSTDSYEGGLSPDRLDWMDAMKAIRPTLAG
jgi:hypothetical protein